MQSVIVFLVILPILTSVVVRTFGWIVILGRQGVINQALLGLGVISEPLKLLYTEAGVVMVLAQVQMPLMVLPILTVMSKIDPNLSLEDVNHVVSAVQNEVKGWGLAVSNGYWKPVLQADVAPGAEQHFSDLQMALKGSGIDVIRK